MVNERWSLILPIILVCWMTLPVYSFGQSSGLSGQILDDLAIQIMKIHPDPFNRVSKDRFFKDLDRISQSWDSLSYARQVTQLSRFVAAIGDGHTYFQPGNFSVFPIRFYDFEDGYFITDIAGEYKEYIGCELQQINGFNIDTVAKRIVPLIARDSNSQLRAKIPAYLVVKQFLEGIDVLGGDGRSSFSGHCSNGKPFNIILNAVEKDQYFEAFEIIPKEFAQYLEKNFNNYYTFADALPRNENLLFLSNPGAMFWDHYNPEQKLFYIKFNFVRNGTISLQAYSQYLCNVIDSTNVEKLVIDLRTNPGGNNSLNPPFFDFIQYAQREKNIQVFIVIGRKTFSAATDLVASIENRVKAVFVGEPTAGAPNHYGNPKMINLPGTDHDLLISSYYWQHGFKSDRRNSTYPDYYLPLYSYDYFNERDQILDFIYDFDFTTLTKSFNTELKISGKYRMGEQEVRISQNDDKTYFIKIEDFFESNLYYRGDGLFETDTRSVLLKWEEADKRLSLVERGTHHPLLKRN